MKKVTITIASKDYTITLDEAFAESFQKDLEHFLGNKKGLDTKELLSAFVQKSYDNYLQDKEICHILDTIDSV